MRKCIFLLLMFCCLALPVRAEIKVYFEPDAISLGESTQLVFQSDTPIKQLPDLTPLEGRFALAGQENRTHVVRINGRKRTKYELVFNLFPRQEGQISTGELSLNATPVGPANLTVQKAGSTANLPITFEASINADTAYPEETLLYTVKLTDGAGLLGAQIKAPDIKNATLKLLNMDKAYQAQTSEGRPVNVIERTFAIIPEKPGYLTIPPTELYGTVSKGPQYNVGDLFEQGMLFNGILNGQKDIRLETNSVQVSVLNKPTGWKGWWLPSTQVAITVQDNFPETISVGDSLSRTIRLTAISVEAERMPTLSQAGTQDLKVYPSPDQRETVQTPGGDIQGVVSLSVIFVPTNGGQLTIPAIRVPWFNTKTRQIEEAILPEKTITVLGTAPTPVESQQPQAPQPETDKKIVSATPALNSANQATQSDGMPLYSVIILIILGVLAGLGLGFFIFRYRRRHRSYRLPTEAELRKKKKKTPLPDLYPF